MLPSNNMARSPQFWRWEVCGG